MSVLAAGRPLSHAMSILLWPRPRALRMDARAHPSGDFRICLSVLVLPQLDRPGGLCLLAEFVPATSFVDDERVRPGHSLLSSCLLPL